MGVLKSKELLNIIKVTRLFARVSDDVLASICDKIEELRLTADMTLFREGEPKDGLYLVVEGML